MAVLLKTLIRWVATSPVAGKGGAFLSSQKAAYRREAEAILGRGPFACLGRLAWVVSWMYRPRERGEREEDFDRRIRCAGPIIEKDRRARNFRLVRIGRIPDSVRWAE